MLISEIIKEAQNRVPEVAPEAISSALDDYVVVDVREPQEVLHGYLPGAVNVPRGTIEFRMTEDPYLGNRGQAILIYSNAGERSVLAALTLFQLGYSNVQSLAGGFGRWSRERRPVA